MPSKPLPLHERALGLLAVRQRSTREMRSRLLRAGFERDEVESEIATLVGVGLLDDEAFARATAEHQLGRRRASRRATESALLSKGIDRATAARVLGERDDAGEEARALELALELALERARRLRGMPREDAFRRLVGHLARRGYAHAVARGAAGRALGLEGADPD